MWLVQVFIHVFVFFKCQHCTEFLMNFEVAWQMFSMVSGTVFLCVLVYHWQAWSVHVMPMYPFLYAFFKSYKVNACKASHVAATPPFTCNAVTFHCLNFTFLSVNGDLNMVVTADSLWKSHRSSQCNRAMFIVAMFNGPNPSRTEIIKPLTDAANIQTLFFFFFFFFFGGGNDFNIGLCST